MLCAPFRFRPVPLLRACCPDQDLSPAASGRHNRHRGPVESPGQSGPLFCLGSDQRHPSGRARQAEQLVKLAAAQSRMSPTTRPRLLATANFVWLMTRLLNHHPRYLFKASRQPGFAPSGRAGLHRHQRSLRVGSCALLQGDACVTPFSASSCFGQACLSGHTRLVPISILVCRILVCGLAVGIVELSPF